MLRHTWTANGLAPFFFIGKEALQPEETTPGVSSEGHLEVFGLGAAKGSLGQTRGTVEELHDRHDQGVQDVLVKQPCFPGFGRGAGMLVAQPGGTPGQS